MSASPMSAQEAGRQMTLASLDAMKLEALRRRNYATANCSKWHAVLTRMQRAASERQAVAYEAVKAAGQVAS